MRCDFSLGTDDMLRDQVVVRVFGEDVRRRLLANEKLTLQSATDQIMLDKSVEIDFNYFHKLHSSKITTSGREDIN